MKNYPCLLETITQQEINDARIFFFRAVPSPDSRSRAKKFSIFHTFTICASERANLFKNELKKALCGMLLLACNGTTLPSYTYNSLGNPQACFLPIPWHLL